VLLDYGKENEKGENISHIENFRPNIGSFMHEKKSVIVRAINAR
jgi:hypothetical protein